MSVNHRPERDLFGKFIDQTTAGINYPGLAMKKLPKFSFERKRYKSMENQLNSETIESRNTSRDEFEEQAYIPHSSLKPRPSVVSPTVPSGFGKKSLIANSTTAKGSFAGKDRKEATSKTRSSMRPSEFVIKTSSPDDLLIQRGRSSTQTRSFAHN